MVKGKKKEIFRRISLELIDRPEDSVRLEISDESLAELAASIAERGLMQPIEVAPRGDRFIIVFGDRRFLAHKQLKKADIMCRVQEMEDDQIALDRAMENLQRVDLSPFEEGHSYHGLMEKFGFSVDEISRRVGKSAGVVQRRMDIIRMPEPFQRAIHAGQVTLSVAEEFLGCPDGGRRQYFLEMAIEHGVTQKVARQWVSDFKKELRIKGNGAAGGGGVSPVYDDVPNYRACDICKDPVKYEDLVDLRICKECSGEIVKVLKKDS